ncbi:MAG: hypothetical protein ONB46_20510, partial [candidate division KSB1 bacterium]|nr:hypothetical protein [candidate division KSB1 bacterium]MDZ7368207.1 hypothetical protein [candidate division KSB1 bacterium]
QRNCHVRLHTPHDENVAQTSCLHAGWKPALRHFHTNGLFSEEYYKRLGMIFSLLTLLFFALILEMILLISISISG